MQKRIFYLTCFLTIVISVGGGLSRTVFAGDKDPSGSYNRTTGDRMTLKDLQKQAAENRKSKGKMKSTTNDDRWAAAKRNADRHAKAVATKQGVRK
jgi:hypothetical protein